MLSVNERNFSQEVLQSSQPVLVHFLAPWCGLCRLIVPVLSKFEAESQGQLRVVYINADENLRLANTYRLTNLPTLLLFEQGQVVYRLEGFQGREELYHTLEGIMMSLLPKTA
jgi:thioredoxin 1